MRRSVNVPVKVAVLLCVSACCSASALAIASQPYSQRLMDACLLKQRVAFGYSFGHGALPTTVTGLIQLHGLSLRTLPVVIGDGDLVFEQTAAAAKRDEAALAKLLFPSILSPAVKLGGEVVDGNVVTLWRAPRHNAGVGNRILKRCFAASVRH